MAETAKAEQKEDKEKIDGDDKFESGDHGANDKMCNGQQEVSDNKERENDLSTEIERTITNTNTTLDTSEDDKKETTIETTNIESQEDDNNLSVTQDGDVDDDDGDPIPSGTGSVSKDCSASELIGWSEILPRWHSKLNQRPKGLNILVRNGIPEPLRGEVWQLLAGAQQSSDLMDKYRIYLMQSAPTEQIILRDVHRTYPAHENFRSGGTSSLLDSLFKVCKAYAVYDEEVGYCQGLSFLVAALLLHMPEEQAFCVFVRIMQNYGLRDLFRNNFDELYLKFYQLEHLLEDHMPDLHQHFTKIGIEPFTYASQWFLTVFTAKFPLNAVFYIMDIFLLDGMNTIFQIALALLGSSKQELLTLDFEGVLKYFRVQMPKRYRNQENVQQLIFASSEISLKKLKKHAKNYEVIKQKEKLLEHPVARLQRENAKLTENNLRLEQENDDLARDLVASKIQLRAQMDVLEDKAETLNRALLTSHQDCQSYLTTISDMEDEKVRLEVEVNQLKEVCRRELHRAESESARDNNIISEYKTICSQLSKRLDVQIEQINKFVESIKDSLLDNENCKERLCHQIFQSKVENLLDNLKNSQNIEQSGEESNNDSTDKSSPQSQRGRDSSTSKPVGAYLKSTTDSQSSSSESKIQSLTNHIDELEVELARTKLALVEAECKCQQLTHDLNVGVTIKSSSNNSSGLSGRLDFVKAAVSTRKSPRVASTAFAKINNIISERISNISAQNMEVQMSAPNSTPLMSNTVSVNNTATSLPWVTSPNKRSINNNNSNDIKIDEYQNQC